MTRAVAAALACGFLLAHLPYLASTLEDIDSVNFALGVRDFDLAAHRPHPPGYPVYVALGKGMTAALGPWYAGAAPADVEARALSVLSLLGALAAVAALYALFACWSSHDGVPDGSRTQACSPGGADQRLVPWGSFDRRVAAQTALALTCPLFWYLAVRPMSDMPGLTAAVAAQAALALAWWRQRPTASGDRRLTPERMIASGRWIVLGALMAGVSMGLRSQNAALTLPLLAGVLVDRLGRGALGAFIGSSVALVVGVSAWAVPLVAASGGLEAYLAALGSQAGEDFAGVEMVYLSPSPRLIVAALVRTFVYPWDSVVLGSVMTGLAMLGAAWLAWRDRRTLAFLALAALPYLGFHLLFQDTSFVRYALPLMPPVAWLAATGLLTFLPRGAVPAIGVLVVWSLTLAMPVLAAYGGQVSPTHQALIAMRAARATETPGALAMHQTFQRPLEAEDVAIAPQLPSPPRREWLELVKYWREGRIEPLWFLADPQRTDLALIDPASRTKSTDFVWQFSSLSQLGGMRPSHITWYRLSPPGWFVEEGWALTPETAGMARLMGRGPSLGPITAWIRRRAEAVRVLVGGRHLGATGDPAAVVTIAIDGRVIASFPVSAGFFVHDFRLPAGALQSDGPLAHLTVQSVSSDPARDNPPTAIEQFDLQAEGTLMWAYDEGWHEAEYNQTLGLWRWSSARSTWRILGGRGDVGMEIRVEDPRRSYSASPLVRIRAGDYLVAETVLGGQARWAVTIPRARLDAAGGRVTLETAQTFVPFERGGPPDRRQLGLRVFDTRVTSQP
ncbi:MAG: protein O-mannosyl-transferase family [Acidobacteriota bacterium]